MNVVTQTSGAGRKRSLPWRRIVQAALVSSSLCMAAMAHAAHAEHEQRAEPTYTLDSADAHTLDLGGPTGQLQYYVAKRASTQPAPTQALIVMLGYPRDVARVLVAGEKAVAQAGREDSTLVVAPLFQVDSVNAKRCTFRGTPAAGANDALWNCGTWLAGEPAQNASVTSFQAMDKLLAALKQQWPSLQQVTIAGFSAGAQFTQHYIGFAHPPADLPVRYVVSDPGTWLYFDDLRPNPPAGLSNDQLLSCVQGGPCELGWQPADIADCNSMNKWKYGVWFPPKALQGDVGQARDKYAQADISYIVAADDEGMGPGVAARVLDRSCAAEAQGTYRLQRELMFVDYDRKYVSKTKPRPLTVVPDCKHSMTCVFTSPAGNKALFADPVAK